MSRARATGPESEVYTEDTLHVWGPDETPTRSVDWGQALQPGGRPTSGWPRAGSPGEVPALTCASLFLPVHGDLGAPAHKVVTMTTIGDGRPSNSHPSAPLGLISEDLCLAPPAGLFLDCVQHTASCCSPEGSHSVTLVSEGAGEGRKESVTCFQDHVFVGAQGHWRVKSRGHFSGELPKGVWTCRGAGSPVNTCLLGEQIGACARTPLRGCARDPRSAPPAWHACEGSTGFC